jgi:hypothetical protein
MAVTFSVHIFRPEETHGLGYDHQIDAADMYPLSERCRQMIQDCLRDAIPRQDGLTVDNAAIELTFKMTLPQEAIVAHVARGKLDELHLLNGKK